jgi:hypothetical protein
MRESEGVFVLTSDVDWASEYCLSNFVNLCSEYGIVPTLFVTHHSLVLTEAAKGGRCELGIHPNFLPNSTHGATVDDVVRHVLDIVPDPVAARSHAYVDSTYISLSLLKYGVQTDSNLLLHLQPGLEPLHHWSGLLRLPVFFEEDAHWYRGLPWSFGNVERLFYSPGLKILNFHPFMVALNLDSDRSYQDHRARIRNLDPASAESLAVRGPGCTTFLREAIERILAVGGRFITLRQQINLIRECPQ